MRLSVGIEFLLSGALLVLGIASFAETIRPALLLEPLRELLIAPQTRLDESLAIAVGTAFLGFCYVVGVLVNASIYDFFLRSRMQATMTQILEGNEEIMARIRSLPPSLLGEKDLYETISAWLDTLCLEPVQRRKGVERSLQRIARGSIPGIIVLLVTGLLRVKWDYVLKNYRSDPGYVVIWILVLAPLVALVWLAIEQLRFSMRDEALYLARVFTILGRHDGRPAPLDRPVPDGGAPRGPAPVEPPAQEL